jgi:hypothetical protein
MFAAKCFICMTHAGFGGFFCAGGVIPHAFSAAIVDIVAATPRLDPAKKEPRAG